ncbi:MAG: tlde1 domain-containing protein [Rhodoblastus sp.]
MQTDIYGFEELKGLQLPKRRRWRRTAASLLGSSLAIAFLAGVGAQMLENSATQDSPAQRTATNAPDRAQGRADDRLAEPPGPLSPRLALRAGAELLDPSYSLGGKPATFSLERVADASLRPATSLAAAQMTDLRARMADAQRPLEPAPAQQTASAQTDSTQAATPVPVARPQELALAEPDQVFLPPRRPADLAPAPAPRAQANAQAEIAPAKPAHPRPGRATRTRTANAKAAPREPGFFEKLFGGGNGGVALAYAPADGGLNGGLNGGGSGLTGVSRSETVSDRFTAVYDISAKVVHMPDGTRLEAHSGLGKYMDNPRYAHLRMRGVTPPALYDLREREALFHGVRAIRLTPVNSSIHGRNGILAHTYMLGPSGQSNGCVSFRDYNKFLNAFLRGHVKRLKVVSSL